MKRASSIISVGSIALLLFQYPDGFIHFNMSRAQSSTVRPAAAQRCLGDLLVDRPVRLEVAAHQAERADAPRGQLTLVVPGCSSTDGGGFRPRSFTGGPGQRQVRVEAAFLGREAQRYDPL